MDLWPDLRAAMSGRREQYTEYYKVAESVIDSITGAVDNRHGSKRVLTQAAKELVSINALHIEICTQMKLSYDPLVSEAPVPCKTLLEISLSPRYECRATASSYSGRFNLTRGILQATLRKDNPDAHYNHTINRNVNSFVIDFNRRLLNYFPNLMQPGDNGILFSKGCTKVSADDKGAVPVGEPGSPVRSNVRQKSATLRMKILYWKL
jgi:hypothetical protein